MWSVVVETESEECVFFYGKATVWEMLDVLFVCVGWAVALLKLHLRNSPSAFHHQITHTILIGFKPTWCQKVSIGWIYCRMYRAAAHSAARSPTRQEMTCNDEPSEVSESSCGGGGGGTGGDGSSAKSML